VQPYGRNVLIAGTTGAGKSTLAAGFLEHLEEQGYQFVIIDPEGDYSTFPGAVVLGDEKRPPSVSEVLDVLAKPEQNATVNMIGVALTERPAFFEQLLPRLQELRAKTGRPHWILVDESHHVVPFSWEAVGVTVPQRLYSLMLITLEPDRLSPAVLADIDLLIAVGEDPSSTLKIFSETLGHKPPPLDVVALNSGEAIAWFPRTDEPPALFRCAVPRSERRRHRRKYVEGELAPDECFYFRGPEGKLNLKAQNLSVFLQIADGVDNETWLFHLQNGDISKWFRDVIKDPDLALEAESRQRADVTAAESRSHIRSEIELRYILAA
jgi:hypothetical protein